MKIDSEKFKKECSEFYRLGYKTSCLDILMFLKNEILDLDQNTQDQVIKLIEKARDRYHSYPCIDHLEKITSRLDSYADQP